MPRTTARAHRIQFLGAVLGTIAAVYGVSRLVKPSAPAPTPVPVAIKPAVQPVTRLPEPPVPPAPPRAAAMPEFLAALEAGDRAKLDKLYQPGMDLRDTFHAPCLLGRTASVAWLLEHGANPQEDTGKLSESPLLMADAFPDVVKLLHEQGMKDGPLDAAAAAGAPNAVGRILVNDKPDAHAKSQALSAAIEFHGPQRQAVVDKLLAAGARAAGPGDGTSPLAAAVATCLNDATQADSGAQWNQSCLALLRSLIAHGAKTTSAALITILGSELDRSAVLDVVLSAPMERGATTMAMIEVGDATDIAVVRKIAARGVDWAYDDGTGDGLIAPLMAAAERGESAVVKKFLDVGAPPDQILKDGRSALGLAIDSLGSHTTESAVIVELLLAKGASANRRLGDGRTPLFAAAEAGDVRTVNALLDHGARVNEVVLDATALDAAERGGQIAVARILHARGGRRIAKD